MNRGLSVLLILAVLIIAAVVFVLDRRFVAVDLSHVDPKTIGTTLLGFLLIALFIERAMEAYTAVWREPERRTKATAVRQARARVNAANSRIEQVAKVVRSASANAAAPDLQNLHAEREKAVKEHEKAVSDVEAHRSETRFRTTKWSLFLGALIAIAGVRALNSFVDLPEDVQVSKYLFIFLDVVVTAAMLGGGADGIHQIISVFTTAAEEKKADAEGRNPVS